MVVDKVAIEAVYMIGDWVDVVVMDVDLCWGVIFVYGVIMMHTMRVMQQMCKVSGAYCGGS